MLSKKLLEDAPQEIKDILGSIAGSLKDRFDTSVEIDAETLQKFRKFVSLSQAIEEKIDILNQKREKIKADFYEELAKSIDVDPRIDFMVDEDSGEDGQVFVRYNKAEAENIVIISDEEIDAIKIN